MARDVVGMIYCADTELFWLNSHIGHWEEVNAKLNELVSLEIEIVHFRLTHKFN